MKIPRISEIAKRSLVKVDPTCFCEARSDLPRISVKFEPCIALGGGHRQTLAGAYWPGSQQPYGAQVRRVALEQGDQLVLHDDRPINWLPRGWVVLMIPGLGSCHQSRYMVRIAARLNDCNVRTFRMDHRGVAAGFQLAQRPGHAGRSEDALAALQRIEDLCPGSPIALIGFSMGGNIALKLLGERPDDLPDDLVRAFVVAPPIDLAECSRKIDARPGRIYQRYFLRHLMRHFRQRRRSIERVRQLELQRTPRSIYEFDDQITAPLSGYVSADDYYRQASAKSWLPLINIPTRIVAANDDPIVPIPSLRDVPRSPSIDLVVTESGGHLGYVAAANSDPDRRWLDWRIVEWVVGAQELKISAEEDTK